MSKGKMSFIRNNFKKLFIGFLLLNLFGIIFLVVVDRFVVVNGLTDPLYDEDLNAVPAGMDKNVDGVIFTSTLINLLETEFNRPFGDYRPDNIVWFGGLMPFDNVNEFQRGNIETLQRVLIFMKERISRSGGGSDQFDKYLQEASQSINYKKGRFILTGMEFQSGIGKLKQYRQGLVDGKSVFIKRTDSLSDLLKTFRENLGATHRNLAKWEEKDGSAVSMYITDNYYYHALGEAYAILAMLRAIKIEFLTILNQKGCMAFLDEAIISLEYATDRNPPWIILDGDRDAQFWPNHRSNLETDINDSRFKIVSIMDNIRQ